MNFHNANASVFVPDKRPLPQALKRITHLGIGAHADDLEFMAFQGIAVCYASKSKSFGGVTCTDGRGSPRTGRYAKFSDAQMVQVRRKEQERAAVAGRYGLMIQLGYPSSVVKNPRDAALKNDLKQILSATQPEVVYTHNPADKHETHIGVVVAVLQGIREAPRALRPSTVWGCEVWRGLDWLPDEDKILMDVTGHASLATKLHRVFQSQIGGGKRYDLAVLGRRRANATFLESHAGDRAKDLIFGIDLTPLVADDSRDILGYVSAFIEKFKTDVQRKLRRRLGT